MKRLVLLTFGLLFAMFVTAQNNIDIISEDFSGNDIPEGWTKAGVGKNNWYISPSFSAGGKVNELQLYWSPMFSGTSRFVSPAVDMTGINSAMLSLDVYVVIFSGKAKIGVATSSDGGNIWHSVWSEEYTKTEQVSIVNNISSPDMGKENVNFCLYFEGVSSVIQSIYFDNFKVYTVENLNIELSSIDVRDHIAQGENTVSFTVKNIGETTIKSFEAKCLVNGEEAFSESFYTELNYLDSLQFAFEEMYDFNYGKDYEIEIEIFRVNDDDYSSDSNTLKKDINIALGRTQRTPMIEHFSSSTCGPCVAVNTTMVELTDNNKGKYTYTKYTANGPGLGDPYYTDEVGTKMSYYNVLSVPQIHFDGTLVEKTSINDEIFQNHYNTYAIANTRGAFNVEGNTINIIADFMTYFDAKNIKAYVSVNEKTTTGNVGTNGETEFHHVMLKMLNDENGTELSINAGEYKRLEFSYDMSQTFMEDINDLEVALWLQNDDTKEIYNSHFAYEYTSHCYPVRNVTTSSNGNNLTIKWNAPEKGNPVGYNVYVDGKLTAEKILSCEYSVTLKNNRYIEVVAVYENDMTSVGVTRLIAEENIIDITENTVNIYPNPVNDRLYIETEVEIKEVAIYTITGVMVGQQTTVNRQQTLSIDVNHLNSGVYFVKIVTNEGEVVKRIVKNVE